MQTINEKHLVIALATRDAATIRLIAYQAVLGLTIVASEKLVAIAVDCESAEEFQGRVEADEIMSNLTRGIMDLILGPDTHTGN